MRFRKLGNTGFDVSVDSFGTWQLGGGRWRTAGSEENIELLRHSLDLGINLYDAAVVYGQYRDTSLNLQSRSQELLGEAFGKSRSKVFYCIKIGQFDEFSHRALFEPGRLVEQFQQSLRRLKTDYIDICLIHAPSLTEVRRGAALGVVKTLQALSLVRAVGYSFENEPHHVLSAIRQDIDVIMLQYNMLDRECAEAIEKARVAGIGILVGGPLKRGYLSGQYQSINDLPLEDDYWRWNLDHNPGKVEATLSQVRDLMRPFSTARDFRKHALQFVLTKVGVASAVIGHRCISEVQENIQLSEEVV